MPFYAYTAKQESGGNVKGHLEAADENQLMEILHQRKLIPLSFREERVKKPLRERPSPGIVLFQPRIKLNEVLLFASQLSAMVEAGLPLLRCLQSFSKEIDNSHFRNILESVSSEVEEGSTLHDALAKHPRAFGSLFVNMVRAGEISGRLDQALAQLSSYLEKMADLRRKLVSAITYPSFLIVFTTGAVLFLVISVVPVFQRIYRGFGARLPTPTRILLSASSTIREYGLVFLGAAVLVAIVCALILRRPGGRYAFDRYKLKMPLFGPLLKKYALVKFTRTLGVLINSGVPILASLDLVAETAGNSFIERAIRDSSTAIERGRSFAESMSERREVFPEMVIQMASTGEESGALDKMLTKVSNFYEQQIESTIAALTSLLEPVLIVLIGGVIGSILLSIFLPIFRMGRAFH
ncbi:MAG: type II secretion system F family protein [Deltaproteobacteria bacterium]|nr:type II secretion system F family protein [Deltaproteobacteria bacterium]